MKAGAIKFKSYQGISLIGVLFLVFVLGFMLNVLIKIIPVYMDNYAVETALDSLKKGSNLSGLTRAEILQMLNKRLEVSQVQTIQDNNLQMMRGEKDIIIKLHYEVRKNVIANADVVLTFDHEIVANTQP